MVVAAFDLFVDNHAVKPFLGRLGDQLLGQRNVLFASETETINDRLDLIFGLFDSFANLNYLLAGKQRNLPHLLEVHPDRVVQNVEAHL